MVGHEPDLGDLAARLIGAPAGSIPLRKAGLALLEPEGLGDPVTPAGQDPAAFSPGPGIWRLRLLLSPRLLLS
jgi:phosphohistidine phosphatase